MRKRFSLVAALNTDNPKATRPVLGEQQMLVINVSDLLWPQKATSRLRLP